jgi:hypothetical protein
MKKNRRLDLIITLLFGITRNYQHIAMFYSDYDLPVGGFIVYRASEWVSSPVDERCVTRSGEHRSLLQTPTLGTMMSQHCAA